VVVWSGAPRRGPVFGAGTAKSLAWSVAGVLGAGLAFFVALDVAWFAVALTLWGLHESGGTRLVQAFVLRRTVYTITDLRLVVATGRTRSTPRANLLEPTVTDGPDGVGDLVFFGAAGPIRFRNIEDARRVRDVIAASWADHAA
jgi:hypothetical protein